MKASEAMNLIREAIEKYGDLEIVGEYEGSDIDFHEIEYRADYHRLRLW